MVAQPSNLPRSLCRASLPLRERPIIRVWGSRGFFRSRTQRSVKNSWSPKAEGAAGRRSQRLPAWWGRRGHPCLILVWDEHRVSKLKAARAKADLIDNTHPLTVQKGSFVRTMAGVGVSCAGCDAHTRVCPEWDSSRF